MEYPESWLNSTALDYDMEVDDVKNVVNKCSPDDDIYDRLEEFIASRAYAEENGL
jgi:hypothetical protein